MCKLICLSVFHFPSHTSISSFIIKKTTATATTHNIVNAVCTTKSEWKQFVECRLSTQQQKWNMRARVRVLWWRELMLQQWFMLKQQQNHTHNVSFFSFKEAVNDFNDYSSIEWAEHVNIPLTKFKALWNYYSSKFTWLFST